MNSLTRSAGAAAPATQAPAAAGNDGAAEVISEVLVRSDRAWNGAVYPAYPASRPQLTVIRMTVPARSTLPWHTHAAPNAGYVLSGHLTLEDRSSGRTQTFAAGEAFTEQMGAQHRGFTDDVPCVVVLTYAGSPDLPTSTPAPDR